LSDEETIRQIQENPYLQHFVGFDEFQKEEAFAASLFVEIRRRMGEETFSDFNQAIIGEVERREANREKKKKLDNEDADGNKEERREVEIESIGKDGQDEELDKNKGKMIVDATVAPQAIRYPTDIDLLNESRQISEQIIDVLYQETELKKKPRTYRKKARKNYLSIVKRRRPSGRIRRKGIRKQLQYVRRNLKHINKLLDIIASQEIPLSHYLLRRYWIIQEVYRQQNEMYQETKRKCENRIVSISQPQVRPIVRGKANKKVEFGAKLSVSLRKSGIAIVDRIGWNAFNESGDLKMQVEKYREVHGTYPESVVADPIYGTRENRKWLKRKGIRYCGKPLGRPPKETPENKEELKKLKKQRRAEYRERIPIEGKFGQGKNGYGLGYIRAKTAKTSQAWINSIFLVMNLMVLEKVFLLLKKISVIYAIRVIKAVTEIQNNLKYKLKQQQASTPTTYQSLN